MAVLDASAILAMLQSEPGADRVASVLGTAVVGAVNYSEVLSKLADKGFSAEQRRAISDALVCEIVGFDAALAEQAADLRPISRRAGLSFADRACLALAIARGEPAMTTDRAWAGLDLGIEIEVIR